MSGGPQYPRGPSVFFCESVDLLLSVAQGILQADEPQFTYYPAEDIWIISGFRLMQTKCHEYAHAGFCVDVVYLGYICG